MDEVEVQVIHPQVGQGLPAGLLHVLRVVLGVPQLGRDEDLLPGNPRGPDTRSHLNRKINTKVSNEGEEDDRMVLPQPRYRSRQHSRDA